jgi:outer membrane immunogenic protein
MLRLLLSAASVVALTAAANAADMYRPAPAAEMPYVGVNWNGLYLGVNGGYGWVQDATSFEGAFGGGQIGYNIQRGNLVFGLEADIQGSDIKQTNGMVIDYFGTARGRLGYSFDRALVYGTGGYAYASGNDVFNSKTTQDGWAAGGGIEYKFGPSWSGKFEYQYLDFAGNGTTLRVPNKDVAVDTVRLGLNYFVGGGYAPLK